MALNSNFCTIHKIGITSGLGTKLAALIGLLSKAILERGIIKHTLTCHLLNERLIV